MARPKEFDRDDAVRNALKVFWAKGYEGASTDDLLTAMKIGRQSMYDTFGDKHALFLAALRCYHQMSGAGPDPTEGRKSALQVLRAYLATLARKSEAERAQGCMGINATTALGRKEPEVVDLAAKTARLNHALMARLVQEAQAAGELAPDLDPQKAAKFLYALLQGLTVRAQAGASVADLNAIADFAIEALTAMS